MIPPKTKQKYIDRFKELITKGESIKSCTKTILRGTNPFTGKVSPNREVIEFDWPSFVELNVFLPIIYHNLYIILINF